MQELIWPILKSILFHVYRMRMSNSIYIISENDYLEIAKILLAKVAKVDIKNYKGKGALEFTQ